MGKKIRLDKLVQNKKLTGSDEYRKLLKKYQLDILNSQLILHKEKKGLVVVLEGPDASGKGGAIKRFSEKLDPRFMRVYSIVKPTTEEFNHHYMRRFWIRLPAHGQIGIFDRSWYGRVLVERVEGFCSKEDWQRAYKEINDFEQQLHDGGLGILKVYLHISKDEQLSRFKKREGNPYKHWKMSDEDWRNRKRWDDHNLAAEDMFVKTSTEIAPWNVIPANYKWFARVEVARLVSERLQKLLDK